MHALLKAHYSDKTIRLWQAAGFFIVFAVSFSAHAALGVGPQRSSVNFRDFHFGPQSTAAKVTASVVEQLTPPTTPRLTANYTLTSYTSIAALTDASPFTTASGSRVHDGTVAANCLAFGTQLRIPELFGDQIFTVEDRLNPRKGCGIIDVWLPTYAEAKQFGVKFTKVEVF